MIFKAKAILLLALQAVCFWGFSQSNQSLDWFTYYGGEELDVLYDVIRLEDGSVIVSGYSESLELYGTGGSHQPFNAGFSDIFLARFDSEGNRLWATYFGGENFEGFGDIALIDEGTFALAGTTNSSSGIASPNAAVVSLPDNSYNTGFIAIFNYDGELINSTYSSSLGAFNIDALAIADDSSIFAGGTGTPNIASQGAFQEVHMGLNEGVISKYNPDGVVQWTTFFGTPSQDAIRQLEISSEGDLVFLARTESTEGLAMAGADMEFGSGKSFVLGAFSSDGVLLWSTYVSGNGDEQNVSFTLGSDDEIYVFGRTSSTSGIATPGSHLETNIAANNNEGAYTYFVRNYSSSGSLIWGTYFGETGISFTGIPTIKFAEPNLYIAGSVNTSAGFVFGNNPFQAQNNSTASSSETVSDCFLAKMSTTGQVLWSTYFGGNFNDAPTAVIPFEGGSKILLAGATLSTEFYANPSSYQSERAGNFDGFLAVLSDNVLSTPARDASESFRVFPNPSLGELMVSWSAENFNAVDLNITDLQGRTLLSVNNYINGSALSLEVKSGVYLLIIENNQERYAQKLIVQ